MARQPVRAPGDRRAGVEEWRHGAYRRTLRLPGGAGIADPGVAAALRRLGVAAARAERWRLDRAYAVQHLWALGDHAVNRLPAG